MAGGCDRAADSCRCPIQCYGLSAACQRRVEWNFGSGALMKNPSRHTDVSIKCPRASQCSMSCVQARGPNVLICRICPGHVSYMRHGGLDSVLVRPGGSQGTQQDRCLSYCLTWQDAAGPQDRALARLQGPSALCCSGPGPGKTRWKDESQFEYVSQGWGEGGV